MTNTARFALLSLTLLAMQPSGARAQEVEAGVGGGYAVAELGALLVEANIFEGRSDAVWAPMLWGLGQLIAGTTLLATLENPLGDPWAGFAATLLLQGGWHAIGFPLTLALTSNDGESATEPNVALAVLPLRSDGVRVQMAGAF